MRRRHHPQERAAIAVDAANDRPTRSSGRFLRIEVKVEDHHRTMSTATSAPDTTIINSSSNNNDRLHWTP